MFLCPKCERGLGGFRPERCACGHCIPKTDSVLRFTEDPAISLDVQGSRYLGYEYVGTNYDGGLAPAKSTRPEDYGAFGDCAAALVKRIGRGGTVVDIGCGLGSAAIPLALTGAQVAALDISDTMLAEAERRARAAGVSRSIVFARMNGYRLYLADGCADAVLAVDMLHQVDEPERVIREIVRILKPGGVFADFGCKGLPLSEEEQAVNRRCGEALTDIRCFYQEALTKQGYRGAPFSSWEQADRSKESAFLPLETIELAAVYTWTEKMKKEITKLRTRASGSAQLIPDALHRAAWDSTDAYAREKYGANYADIPGFSRFAGVLQLYRPR